MSNIPFSPHIWGTHLHHSLQNELTLGRLCSHLCNETINQWGDVLPLDIPPHIPSGDPFLIIDHGAYFNFPVHNVSALQSHSAQMDAALRGIVCRLTEDTDAYLLSVLRSGAGCRLTRPIPFPEEGGLYPLLLDIKRKLDAEEIPRFNRKLLLPASLESALLTDNRFITVPELLTEGAAARAAGFDIYISAHLEQEIICLLPEAFAFASQITRMEAYHAGADHHSVVKGLCLSGAKVLLPSAICICTLTP